MARVAQRPERWLAGPIVLALLLLPLPAVLNLEVEWITGSLLFSLTQMFMLLTLASSWNLVGGFTGYIDFGYAAFFGLGAYGTAILMNKADWSFPPALLVGAVVATLFAFLIGRATLRLKGPYFSIAMLGTFVALREVVRVSRTLTGGGTGLTLPPYLNRPLFYYLCGGLALLVVVFAWWLKGTSFGLSLIAIREDEIGAEMRGVNTTRHKIAIFCIAAFFAGLVGGLWAYQNTYIDPDIVFIESRTADVVMATMLGGIGTIAGPIVGTVVLFWLRDILWANFLQIHLLLQGIILLLIVLYAPAGIMGAFDPSARESVRARLTRWARQQ